MPFRLPLFALAACSLALGGLAVDYGRDALADEVTSLPGLEEDISFRHFSGYIDVGDGKQIHYWFIEASDVAPEDAPVVFWTNGGPGCSGMIGLFTENGPFRPTSNSTLGINEYSWNKIANMLYVEAPAGVGFSIQPEIGTGDKETAEDNLVFLQNWMDRFDAYKVNDLYIGSESYGGHYMPTLATEIVKNDKTGLLFSGAIVFNPYVDWASGNPSMFKSLWGKQVVPKPVWDEYVEQGCLPRLGRMANIEACVALEAYMYTHTHLNRYALNYPQCVGSQGRQERALLRHVAPHVLGGDDGDWGEGYEPCAEDWMTDYLNLPEVQEAIHVQPKKRSWIDCVYTIGYHFVPWELVPMEPLYRFLLGDNGYSRKLKFVIGSGDDDSVCPTFGAQDYIYNLGPKVTSLWQPWMIDGQTSGFLTNFDAGDMVDFAFITVHGAGHEVPAYKPKEALQLFESFLDGSIF